MPRPHIRQLAFRNSQTAPGFYAKDNKVSTRFLTTHVFSQHVSDALDKRQLESYRHPVKAGQDAPDTDSTNSDTRAANTSGCSRLVR